MRDMREQLSAVLPFWTRLTALQKDSLTASARVAKYTRSTTVHSCGDRCLGILAVVSGMVRVVLTSEEGRELTLFRLRASDIYVLSAVCVIHSVDYDVRFECETETELLIIPCHIFDALYKANCDVQLFAFETANRAFALIVSAMQKSLFMGFDKRLALYLWDESAGNDKARIATTHERIAKNIGSAREVVTRTLKKFSAEGIVTLERGAVIVPDREKLKRYFEF